MATVSKAIYIVIYSQRHWWVDFEGKAMGPCPDKETAARDALRIARSHMLDDRPYEIWMALPEGTQRLSTAALRERTAALPSAPVAAPVMSTSPQAMASSVSPVTPALPSGPILVAPPPIVVAPRRPMQQAQLPPAAILPVPPQLPPPVSLI